MAATLIPTQQPKGMDWTSPLLRLPGEVRNEIYEYIAEDDTLFIRPESNSFSVSSLYSFSTSLRYRSYIYNADEQIFNKAIQQIFNNANGQTFNKADQRILNEYLSVVYASALTIQTVNNAGGQTFNNADQQIFNEYLSVAYTCAPTYQRPSTTSILLT
jgi:hypothetical protein